MPHNLQQYIHTACKHHPRFSAFAHQFLCTTLMMWSNHKSVSISANFIKHFPTGVSQIRVNKYENSTELSQQQVWLWAVVGTARGISSIELESESKLQEVILSRPLPQQRKEIRLVGMCKAGCNMDLYGWNPTGMAQRKNCGLQHMPGPRVKSLQWSWTYAPTS